jgi:hypothetical protein
MTPEELEAIPGIDEEVVGQIQAVVVSFYGQYEEEAATEMAPGDTGQVEEAIDASSPATGDGFSGDNENLEVFENIETGVLEHDLARHEAVLLDTTDEGEALDLGRVEGLSGAPSTLRDFVESEGSESAGSDTMKTTE